MLDVLKTENNLGVDFMHYTGSNVNLVRTKCYWEQIETMDLSDIVK